MKKKILIISFCLFCSNIFSQNIKYVIVKGGDIFINEEEFCENIYISDNLVDNNKQRKIIKLIIFSHLVDIERSKVIQKKLQRSYKVKREMISDNLKIKVAKIIYYLLHSKHGNLPLVIGRDAYCLLDIPYLNNQIFPYKKLLFEKDMLMIDSNEKPILLK